MRTLRSLAFTTVLGAALLANTTPASAEPPPDDSTSRFSIEALTKNTYSAPLRKPAHDQGFQVMRLGDGEAALVDSSLVSAGLATATKPEAVEISWVAQSNAQGYTIVRDNVKIADLGPGVDYYRDSKITPGATHQYIVTPTSLTKGTHPVWGMKITVPQTKAGEEKADTLGRYADIRSSAAAAEGETTVTWETFIPQAKVDAPPIGCEYGSGYQFGGDNRSYDWTSSRFRTALSAVIDWETKDVGGYGAVGATTVYNAKTGALVATKTASDNNLKAYGLGSGSNYVDLRLVNHAANPFCSVGAIDGAITMQVTQSGNWSIRSGNHRQMPNHHIYFYNGGTVTDAYKRDYANTLCLIGSAVCPLVDLTGFSGTYQ